MSCIAKTSEQVHNDMTTPNINVRQAIQEDASAIIAFQQAMARETEGKTLDAELLGRGVQSLFDNPEKGFYLVAEASGKVIAGLLITYEWSDWRNATFWWIQSVYVDAEWRRKGVYRALHDHVHAIADSRDDICGIRLYVERTNDVAQQTYDSLGMSKSHYVMYEIDFVL